MHTLSNKRCFDVADDFTAQITAELKSKNRIPSKIFSIYFKDDLIYLGGGFRSKAFYWVYDTNYNLIDYRQLDDGSLAIFSDEGIMIVPHSDPWTLLTWDGQRIKQSYRGKFMQYGDNAYIVGNDYRAVSQRFALDRGTYTVYESQGYFYINDLKIQLREGDFISSAIIVPKNK